MLIKKLSLTDFRSYSKKKFSFNKDITLLVGPNAIGKTNVLEAIYLLAAAKSPRVGLEEEMIRKDKDIARLGGEIVDDKEGTKLEIVLTKGEFNGKRVAKKRLFLNGIARRMNTFAGNLKAVLFRPEDLQIILGSPSLRRDYLDSVLIQTDREYYRSLLTYKKGLRQRNKILLKVREGETSKPALYFWDNLLIKNGQYISKKRQELIEYISSCQIDSKLCVNLFYDKSVISKLRLEQYEQTSIASATTLVGPHRDDFVIKDDSRDLAFFGSRGEQRLATLALKLSELTFIKDQTSKKPILLLDDIFSELDEEHRSLVLEAIDNHQSIMTSTETEWLDKQFLDKIKIIKIKS